jgi:D-alanyl-D-alanine carboxypeptidase/D-alanyl-D-alanine-endopeptidase (penicillin-binding protein 4)
LLAGRVAAQSLPEAVMRPLQAAGVDVAHVAVVVADARSGVPRLEHNARLPMNPASVMKLVTTYAGLGMLGPSHTWKTAVLSDGVVDARGVLKGNLYLRGSGDPKLTQERVWLLMKELRARGVRTIAGDVVLDRGLFDVAGLDPGQFDQQPLRAYNVTPDALLMHWKALELRFVPQPEGVRVLAEPALKGVAVVSRLRPVAGNCDNWRQGLRYALQEARSGATLQFEGGYPAECGEKSWSLAVLDHRRFTRALLENLWTAVGGKLTGTVREGSTPVSARILMQSESAPLSEIVRDINKWSNNVMARQVLLSLGAVSGTGPVREEHGVRAVRAWLTAQGLALPELMMENGSGLSRVERISAGGLAQLLVSAAASPVMPEYLASLPIGGVDGTMQKRLTHDEVTGRARIKTGTLDGVRAAAGYVQDRLGRAQVVVMLINDANAQARDVREAEDALIRWAYNARP